MALESWLTQSTTTEDPIFKPITRHGEIKPSRLSKEAVSRLIKAKAKTIGLDPINYSGHSLRAGLATSASQAGVKSHAIRQQTGHKSDAMLDRYIRDGELFSNNAVIYLL